MIQYRNGHFDVYSQNTAQAEYLQPLSLVQDLKCTSYCYSGQYNLSVQTLIFVHMNISSLTIGVHTHCQTHWNLLFMSNLRKSSFFLLTASLSVCDIAQHPVLLNSSAKHCMIARVTGKKKKSCLDIAERKLGFSYLFRGNGILKI